MSAEQLVPITRPVTKVELGLEKVDNVPDDDKPVSKKQQAAIDAAKAEAAAETAEQIGALPSPSAPASFEHIQAVASSEWIMNHNFGYYPIFAVIDDGGNEVEAEIAHITLNQSRARFSAPQTGQARAL